MNWFAGWWMLLMVVSVAPNLWADASLRRSPFGITVVSSLEASNSGVRIDFRLPADCVLYPERLHFLRADGTELAPRKMPLPATRLDKVSGHEKQLFDHDFAVVVEPVLGPLVVKFQGCSNAECFFPEQRRFAPAADGQYREILAGSAEPGADASGTMGSATEWKTAAADFRVIARQTGYLPASELLPFLDPAAGAKSSESEDSMGLLRQKGWLVSLALVLLGGLGLNFTPCVLPLIPINLAIIGAGRAAKSRREGFLRGAAYGLGMSLAYGILGLAVVLTGTKFGTLNSSAWFNLIIGVIFLVLALAMFDVWLLDFTRFDRFLGRREARAAHDQRSKWLVAFALGVIAALLAGACVAPVVISVLLMATALNAKGIGLGLALPFALGLGMALPWPFLGASLSFLPKPGQWMVWVKRVFGVGILLTAGYYSQLAYHLFQSRHLATSLAAQPGAARTLDGQEQLLAHALQRARETHKPVFVDFAASWCKNCEALELTVFNQASVQQRLADFIVVKYQAERPNEAPAREVLDHFHVLGLPTYLILSPN